MATHSRILAGILDGYSPWSCKESDTTEQQHAVAKTVLRGKFVPKQAYFRKKINLKQPTSVSEIVQSCPTLCDPMDCGLPGFSVHGIFQARVLEWVAISFSRGSS